jgi:hypothetical protein
MDRSAVHALFWRMNPLGEPMYDRITEVPFIASTTGDGLLSMLFGARRAREKLRENARAQLGVKRLTVLSFGRQGRTRIEPSFLLPYVRVIGTAPAAGPRFERDMQRYGLLQFATEEQDPQLISQVEKFLRSRQHTASRKATLVTRVNHLLAQLTIQNRDVCALAERQREQWRQFSRAERRFRRFPGRLVRTEGDEAVLAVLNEQTSREELRAVEASQLTEVGVNAEGDPVILYETEYAPGVRVATVIPAVVLENNTARERDDEQELRQHETPLPTLAELESAEFGSSAQHSGRKAGG